MTVPAVQTLTEVVEGKVTQDKPQSTFSLAVWCSASWKKIAAEFLATLSLVLFGCMTCIPMESNLSGIYPPLGFGMIVMFNIQTFGHISGAHMNPAVTVAGVIFGNIDLLLAIAYVIVQSAGAIVGYGLLVALISVDFTEIGMCITKPHEIITPIQALGIETAITSALIIFTCAVWDPVNRSFQEAVAIKFGLTVMAVSLSAAPFTGASLNPVRSLGPAVWTGIWDDHWVYWAGPLIAGVIPTIIYKYIFLSKQKD